MNLDDNEEMKQTEDMRAGLFLGDNILSSQVKYPFLLGQILVVDKIEEWIGYDGKTKHRIMLRTVGKI